MQVFVIFAAVCLIAQMGLVAGDWSQWAAGNNGVHTRPVYNVQPNIQWSFKQPQVGIIKGVINIDDSTGNIIVPNSNSSQPLFWVLHKNGTVLYSFNDTDAGSCSGAMGVSNGTLYIVNEISCKVHAFNLTHFTKLWTSSDLCTTQTATPNVTLSAHIWIDETTLYVPMGAVIFALSRNDSSTKWLYSFKEESTSNDGQFLAPVHSPFDNTFVFLGTTGLVVKITLDTGSKIGSYQSNMLGAVYDDPATYPPLVDRENGFIYTVTRNGFINKLSFELQQVWTVNFSPATIIHGAALVDNFIYVMTNDQFYAIDTTSQDYTSILKSQLNIGKVKAQLFYSNNVLYAADGIGNLAAYNVTDRVKWKNLWTMITSVKAIEGAGPAIASDGTIYIGSTSGDSTAPLLVSLGCIYGNILNEDGRCVCPEDKFTYRSRCLTCTGGTYFNATAGCVLCGDGLVPDVNRTACEPCTNDTFSMSGDDVCTPCTIETINDQCPAPPVDPPVLLQPNGKPLVSGSTTTDRIAYLFVFISVLFTIIYGV